MRLSVIGGPADGATVAEKGVYSYLDTDRIHRDDGSNGAGLYKRSADQYVYIGGSTDRCEGCGGFVEFFLVPACPLCGAEAPDRWRSAQSPGDPDGGSSS